MQAKNYLLKARTPRTWTPYLILTYALFITLLSSYYISQTAHKNNQLRFINQVTLFEDNIEDKVSTFTALLLGTRGLFAAEPTVTNADFNKYIESLDIRNRYKGVESIGVVKRFPGSNRAEINTQYGITMYPEPFTSELYPVVYIEPRNERTEKMLGFNMASEERRKTAMDLAGSTGIPTASEKIELIQWQGSHEGNGFNIYVPMYQTQKVPETETERKEQLVGFVYAPFRIIPFIENIFGTKDPVYLDFSIYAGEKVDKNNLLFQTNKENPNYQPTYTVQRTVDVAGQTWLVQYSSTPQFEAYFERYIGELIFVIGTIISFVLFLLSRSQYQARSAVERSAIRVLESEQQLQEINKRVQRILESITDGFFTINKQWCCTYINPEGEKLLNVDTKTLLGQEIWTAVPTIENSELGVFLKKSMKQAQPSGIELFYEPKNSWFSIRTYPSKEGLSVYMQDITKRKNLEKQKDEFIGIASHELKTPVTSIKAYAQVLYRRFIKEGNIQAAHMLQKMDTQIDKLTSLITDLLDATKIEAGKLKLSMEKFEVDTLIADAVEEMQRTTEQHTLTIEGSANCTIKADKDRISQVIINLLSNAIKYSPDANQIIVKVSSSQKSVTVCVQDYGVGIPKKLQKNIFKRFFRVEGSKELTFPGLGLGLYISAEIIKRHNGSISVESEPNQGSRFCFILPCDTTTT